jgi:hypothetical protein
MKQTLKQCKRDFDIIAAPAIRKDLIEKSKST